MEKSLCSLSVVTSVSLCACMRRQTRGLGEVYSFTHKHTQSLYVGSRPEQCCSRALKSPTADVRLKLLCVPAVDVNCL